MNNYLIIAAISAAVALIIGAVLYKIFIPVLRKVKLGQKILEIGPSWHKSKEGTPNLGGVIFIFAFLIACAVGYLLYRTTYLQEMGTPGERAFAEDRLAILPLFISILLLPLLNGLIGFVDDYIKLFKKRNKGLSATQKLVFQFLAAALYLFLMAWNGFIDTVITFPWGSTLDLGIFYYFIMLLIIVYIINCANLTDGIDGLAGSVALIICIMFFIAYGDFCTASLIGALIAFLVFNFHPAKIFMGDTGSLFLGGFIVSLAMASGSEFILLPVSVIWIIEGLSVVLQVASFKLTGKRIFKMSPIHHHFEKCGWSEVKIVCVFSLVTAAFAALAYYLIALLHTL